MTIAGRFFGIVTALAIGGAAGAAHAQPVLSCGVSVDYVLSAQDGTPIDTETYAKDFTVQPGVVFEDDFSTPTRFKLFTASARLEGHRTVVTITYFNDVSTFNSIDFDTQLTLVVGQAAETLSGSQTFSTSTAPLSGHYSTSYTLTCRR